MGARAAWERLALERIGRVGPLRARELLASLGEIRDRILAGARVRPGVTVADLGSGSGLLAFAAAEAAGPGRVVAVDLDSDALGAAREIAREHGVALLRGDARRVPLADRSVGVVVWRSILVYMERREEVLAEARRVLAAGGTLSFSESLGGEMHVTVGDPEIARLWDALREIAQAALGPSAFTPEVLEELVTRAGFARVAVAREPRRTILATRRAARDFFSAPPPGGLSLAGIWRTCGVEEQVVEMFLAGVEAAVPLTIETPEAYVTARRIPYAVERTGG